MTLDFKKPDFDQMIPFMRSENRFASLERIDPTISEELFSVTVADAKNRFFRYARIAGQEEKIREKLAKAAEKKKDA